MWINSKVSTDVCQLKHLYIYPFFFSAGLRVDIACPGVNNELRCRMYSVIYWDFSKNTKCCHSHPPSLFSQASGSFLPSQFFTRRFCFTLFIHFFVCSAEGSKIDIRYINHGSQSTKICTARNKRVRTPRKNCFQQGLQNWFKLM